MNYSLIPPVITYAMRRRRNMKENEHDKDGTHEQRRLKLDQGHAWLSWDPLESGACRSISLRNGITWIFATLAVACVMEYSLFQHNVNKSYNLVSHLLQNIPSKTYVAYVAGGVGGGGGGCWVGVGGWWGGGWVGVGGVGDGGGVGFWWMVGDGWGWWGGNMS